MGVFHNGLHLLQFKFYVLFVIFDIISLSVHRLLLLVDFVFLDLQLLRGFVYLVLLGVDLTAVQLQLRREFGILLFKLYYFLLNFFEVFDAIFLHLQVRLNHIAHTLKISYLVADEVQLITCSDA